MHHERFVEAVAVELRAAPSCTWIIEAWLNAASSLWVEWVVNTSGLVGLGVPMP
jgi:hypothetical protein